MKKLKDILKEFKSQAYFNGDMKIGQVYSNPYARSFTNEDELKEEGLTLEQKQAFLEAVKNYKKYSESVYRTKDLDEVFESIKNLIEVANKVTVDETQHWFDNVTVSRHMKRMNESFKVFEKTLKEVSTLQQRLESAYDEIGEVLGKYYEINELEEGNEFGAARAKAIAAGEDSFEVDGKTYPVTKVGADDKANAKKFAGESVNEARSFKVGDKVTWNDRFGFNIGTIEKLEGNTVVINHMNKNGTYVKRTVTKDELTLKESVNESTKLTDILKKKVESVNENKLNVIDFGYATTPTIEMGLDITNIDETRWDGYNVSSMYILEPAKFIKKHKKLKKEIERELSKANVKSIGQFDVAVGADDVQLNFVVNQKDKTKVIKILNKLTKKYDFTENSDLHINPINKRVNENLSNKIKSLSDDEKSTLSSVVNALGMVPTTVTPKSIHLIKQPVVDELMKLYRSKKFVSKKAYDMFTPIAKALGESVNEAMKEDDFMDRLEDYASDVIPFKDYSKKSTRDLLKQLIGSMRTDKKAKALYTYWSKNKGKDLLDKMGSLFESVNESEIPKSELKMLNTVKKLAKKHGFKTIKNPEKWIKKVGYYESGIVTVALFLHPDTKNDFGFVQVYHEEGEPEYLNVHFYAWGSSGNDSIDDWTTDRYWKDYFSEGDGLIGLNINESTKLTDILNEALTAKDKKVVQAFYNQKPLEGKLLYTDGKTLEKLGMGRQDIAKWDGSDIVITAVMDSRSTQSIVKYLKKYIPSGILKK